MEPPTPLGVSANPRRPPANLSVSLLHPTRRPKAMAHNRSDSSSDSNAAARSRSASDNPADSLSSLQPLGRGSSGESSNAEKWFEKSNNEVRDHSASFADDDPPFFMRNSSSSETPPNGQHQLQSFGANIGSNLAPLRASLLHLGTDGSSTEDFRSVIDDLTIENKKLKQRLKKYERLQDSHLEGERLFEVRIHGLPPEKKRELEETLRQFASSLGAKRQTGFPANGYEGLMPLLDPRKTASPQTSFHNTDSAYASMSASGQGSSARSGNDSGLKTSAVSAAVRRKKKINSSIHSYLYHVPEGLLPQSNPSTMSERAKKRLVVQRLEQIFAGKGAAAAGHQQPLQQQEVSRLAANADRLEMEAQGQHARGEGIREAVIMLPDNDEAQDNGKTNEQNASPDRMDDMQQMTARVAEQDSAVLSSNESTLEQRPTRPLDLDPHRAQVPAENIRYMRHLGFSPTDPHSAAALEEGHGWVYLNLLINMAQLHTINVTPEFVRRALCERSEKFEVSRDGRKVRWRGGHDVTRTSSNGGGSSTDRMSDDALDGRSPRKRPKLSHSGNLRSNLHSLSQAHAGASHQLLSESSKFVYTPLFFHRDSTDEADDSSAGEEDARSSLFPAPVGGDFSGMPSSGSRTTCMKKYKTNNDGPIIFYNNARFCTDLSGERRPESFSNTAPYIKASMHPIGKPQPPPKIQYETRGPLAGVSELPEPMDLVDNPVPESMELSFPRKSPRTSGYETQARPAEMEVTGIGGVWPSDHFAIDVESRQTRIDPEVEPGVAQGAVPKTLPNKFAQIFRGPEPMGRPHATLHKHQVVSSTRRELPPSKLPPALSFMPFDEDYTSDNESEADDDMSVLPESPGAFPPSTAPQVIEIPFGDLDEDAGEDYVSDSGCDDESDSSLDLLAAARAVDPEAVHAKEREYDANMAERLAEDIPAGSSAATAGGGSGFTSPRFDVNQDEYKRKKNEIRESRTALKRAHTIDSVVAQSIQVSSDSEPSNEEIDEPRP